MELELELVRQVTDEVSKTHRGDLSEVVGEHVHQTGKVQIRDRIDVVKERKICGTKVVKETSKMDIENSTNEKPRTLKDNPRWKSMAHLTGEAMNHLLSWRKGMLDRLRDEKKTVEHWGTTRSLNFRSLLPECAVHKTRVAVLKEVEPDVVFDFFHKELTDFYHGN